MQADGEQAGGREKARAWVTLFFLSLFLFFLNTQSERKGELGRGRRQPHAATHQRKGQRGGSCHIASESVVVTPTQPASQPAHCCCYWKRRGEESSGTPAAPPPPPPSISHYFLIPTVSDSSHEALFPPPRCTPGRTPGAGC